MAIAVAPVELEEAQRISDNIVGLPRRVSRWGPPIWSADEPIAALDREPLSKVDIILISVLLAYHAD